MRPWTRAGGLLVLGALGLFGCQPSGDQYEIVPFKVKCQGEARSLCPLGIREGTADGKIFYELEGFTFQWGLIQTVRVSQREVKDPPADGSSILYAVEEVLETRRVPEDATFDLVIDRDYVTGSRSSGYALIDSTRMTCVSSAVCDELETKLGSAETFSLSMGYPAVEGEPLIIREVL